MIPEVGVVAYLHSGVLAFWPVICLTGFGSMLHYLTLLDIHAMALVSSYLLVVVNKKSKL